MFEKATIVKRDVFYSEETMIQLLSLILLACSLFASAQPKRVVTVATGEYPPYTGKQLANDGFVNHIIRLALESQGYQVHFEYLPWKRSFQSTNLGQFDMASYWVCEPEYADSFYCSDEIYKGNLLAYFRKTTPLPKWENIYDLKKFRIGATLGYEYVPEFHKAVEQGELDVLMVTDDKHSLNMLFNDRVDLVLLSDVAMQALLIKAFTPEHATLIHASDKPFLAYTAHVLFPKSREGSLVLKNDFNKGLSQLKRSREWDRQWQRLLNAEFHPDATIN